MTTRNLIASVALAGVVAASAHAATPQGDAKIAGVLIEGQPPYLGDETVELVVRVEGAGHVEDDETARVIVCRLDTAFPWDDALTPRHAGGPRVLVDGGVLRLRVPTEHRLGVVAYSDARGLDEVVIVPVDLRAGDVEVLMSLPHRAPAGVLRLREQPIPWASELPTGELRVRAPVTGITIRSQCRSWRSELRDERLAPGDYRVEMAPFEWVMCGNDRPRTAPAVGWRRDVTIRAGAELVLEHAYVHGHALDLTLTLKGDEGAGEADFARTDAYLQRGWWERGLTDEAEHWYATVSLQRIDALTGAPGEARRLTWGWDTCWISTERPVVPLGRHLTSVSRVACGDYLMTIDGPRIEAVTIELRVTETTDSRELEVALERAER